MLGWESMTVKPETIAKPVGKIPPSGLGPDGKILRLSEEEWRERRESARRRLAEIALIPDGPNDPPDEEWMRESTKCVPIDRFSRDVTES